MPIEKLPIERITRKKKKELLDDCFANQLEIGRKMNEMIDLLNLFDLEIQDIKYKLNIE